MKKGMKAGSACQTRGAGGISIMLTNTASKTAGIPIHHDSADPAVSVHQTKHNNVVRDTILSQSCFVFIDITGLYPIKEIYVNYCCYVPCDG